MIDLIVEINYLKQKLNDIDITEYEREVIQERIKELETIHQKEILRNRMKKRYKNMIKDYGNSIDNENLIYMANESIKMNIERLEDVLLGKFKEAIEEKLLEHCIELDRIKRNLVEFEKSIKIKT